MTPIPGPMINKQRTNDMIVDNLLRADSALQVSMDGKPEASLGGGRYRRHHLAITARNMIA